MADENVDHPSYYGGADNPYEAIKVIEAWDLGFCLGNTVKYISRAGKKNHGATVEDLEKAAWYLNREIVKAKGLLPDKPTELLHVEDDNEECGRGCPVWESAYMKELDRRMRTAIIRGDGIYMAGDY